MSHDQQVEVDEQNFFVIKIDSLRTDLVTGFDLYLPPRSGREPVLYRDAQLPFSDEVRTRLCDNKIAELLVKRTDRHAWLTYTGQVLPEVLANPDVPVVERAAMLYESAQELVHEILANPESGDLIQTSRTAVDSMVGFLFKESTSFYELMQLTSYDYYTYTHSVNVFVYSVSLANKLGLSGKGLFVRICGRMLVRASAQVYGIARL